MIEAALLRGWLVLVVPDSRRVGMRGWPDIVALHPTRRVLIAWECKRESGRVRPDQAIVLALLAAVKRIDVRVIKPSDWKSIERELL